jgi:rod shape-determining protein MreD
MKYVFWVLVTAFIFLIQGSVSFFDITPNLTAALAFYAGIRKREIKGMFLGSLIGLVEDMLSGPFLGPNLLSKGIIGYLSPFIYSKFFMWTPLLGVISISVLTLTDGFIVYMSKSIFRQMPVGSGSAALIIAFQALLNAPLGIFLRPKEYEGRQRQVS